MIYFVESVTSVGTMDPKRIKRVIEIMEMTKNVKTRNIFVTAFLDFCNIQEACRFIGVRDGSVNCGSS